MSRSNPTEITQNPASKFYKWDSDNKSFSWFDKTLGEKDASGKAKGQNVPVALPFNFIVLDQLVCIRGYNEPKGAGYYSNEVRDITKEVFTVKINKSVEKIGTYEQVKTLLGAKYCQSVYIAFKNAKGELEIQNLQLIGAAVNAWISFLKTVKINEIAVCVRQAVEKKKGRNVYFEPVFEANTKISEKTNLEAIELDKSLQVFLSEYLAKNTACAPAQESVKEQPRKETKQEETIQESADDIDFGKDEDEPPF